VAGGGTGNSGIVDSLMALMLKDTINANKDFNEITSEIKK
jgi:hypothetical protein